MRHSHGGLTGELDLAVVGVVLVVCVSLAFLRWLAQERAWHALRARALGHDEDAHTT